MKNATILQKFGMIDLFLCMLYIIMCVDSIIKTIGFKKKKKIKKQKRNTRREGKVGEVGHRSLEIGVLLCENI